MLKQLLLAFSASLTCPSPHHGDERARRKKRRKREERYSSRSDKHAYTHSPTVCPVLALFLIALLSLLCVLFSPVVVLVSSVASCASDDGDLQASSPSVSLLFPPDPSARRDFLDRWNEEMKENNGEETDFDAFDDRQHIRWATNSTNQCTVRHAIIQAVLQHNSLLLCDELCRLSDADLLSWSIVFGVQLPSDCFNISTGEQESHGHGLDGFMACLVWMQDEYSEHLQLPKKIKHTKRSCRKEEGLSLARQMDLPWNLQLHFSSFQHTTVKESATVRLLSHWLLGQSACQSI